MPSGFKIYKHDKQYMTILYGRTNYTYIHYVINSAARPHSNTVNQIIENVVQQNDIGQLENVTMHGCHNNNIESSNNEVARNFYNKM